MTPIETKYAQMGGPSGPLGNPIGPESTCADRVGKYRNYRNGSIYYHPSTNAHAVFGAIRDKWTALQREQGFLRYPVTDQMTTPDGIGRYNHFQGGSIYWHPELGAFEVHGAIRGKWAEKGWENGPLGYPVSDEMVTPGRAVGRMSNFERGAILFLPCTGAFEIHGPIYNHWKQNGAHAGRFGFPLSDIKTLGSGKFYATFEGGVLIQESGGRVREARVTEVPVQAILNLLQEEIGRQLSGSDLYFEGRNPVEFVRVHRDYSHQGKCYSRIMELDLDFAIALDYRFDPEVDVDLFIYFYVNGGRIYAKLIRETHNVDSSIWEEVLMAGVQNIFDVCGQLYLDGVFAVIGRMGLEGSAEFGSALSVQLKDNGTLRVFTAS